MGRKEERKKERDKERKKIMNSSLIRLVKESCELDACERLL